MTFTLESQLRANFRFGRMCTSPRPSTLKKFKRGTYHV